MAAAVVPEICSIRRNKLIDIFDVDIPDDLDFDDMLTFEDLIPTLENMGVDVSVFRRFIFIFSF